MKKSIGLAFLAFVFLMVLLSGCTPASTPTANTSSIKITKVVIVSEDEFGNKAAPGYQILQVWFEGSFYEGSQDIYVIGDDGSKTSSTISGIFGGGSKRMIGFTPPDSAHKFTLYWPGNEPIELTISQ